MFQLFFSDRQATLGRGARQWRSWPIQPLLNKIGKRREPGRNKSNSPSIGMSWVMQSRHSFEASFLTAEDASASVWPILWFQARRGLGSSVAGCQVPDETTTSASQTAHGWYSSSCILLSELRPVDELGTTGLTSAESKVRSTLRFETVSPAY